ncbi:hypothetical protein Dimus_019324 [Dionaea muscipula]
MSAALHWPFPGTPLNSYLDGRKRSTFPCVPKKNPAKRNYCKYKCAKKNQWASENVWFPQFYGRILKLLAGDPESRNGLRVNSVKYHFSRGKDLVQKSISPLWEEGLLLLRCSVFVAVISGVCLLVWYGRARAKEFVEVKLMPSVCSVLSEYIQREVDFGKVRRMSLLSITLESCSVGPHSEEFSCVEAPTIKLRVRPFASLRRGKIVIDAVLSQPTLLVAQKKDFTWLGLPSNEGSVLRHLSTEEGIDLRTRTRRAAREEATACWARERDGSAKLAAEMGYVVTDHSSNLSEGDAKEDMNSSGLSSSGKSFYCTDDGMHWKDHHSLDSGIQYDVKHAELEKSFGVNVPGSRIKSLPLIIFGPLGPKFKKSSRGTDMYVSSVSAKRKILERSSKAALQYFQQQYTEPLPGEGDYGIADIINLAFESKAQTDDGISVLGVQDNGNNEHGTSELSAELNGASTGRTNVEGSSYFQKEQRINDLFLAPSDGVSGGFEKTDKKVPVANNVDGKDEEDRGHNNVGLWEGAKSMDAIDGSSSLQNQNLETLDCISESRHNQTCFDSALVNQEQLPSENHKIPVSNLSLKSNGSFFQKHFGEKLSYLLSGPFQKLKSGMGQKFEDIVAESEEVDGVQTERIEKMLPVTLDSVYFKRGTLMLLAYGDMEPREMENMDGHVKFQNHYGRVHVQLSGNCKIGRSDATSDDGGWLSADVFVDIVDQQWHANLKLVNLFVPLFERILEIPILWYKGRASGEVHICMSRGETFPNLHGQLDARGLSFQILDTPSCFTDVSTTLSFRAQRIFLHNASGWYGDVPLEASGDFGIHPEEGEFHLTCQVPCVEVNSLMKTFKMKPLLFPLAGFVTTIFNCQGPLDTPVFVGSGMVTRKIGLPVSDVYASPAYETVMRDKDVGAVAAIDRIPISYLSANFTFNTDNCIADLYGIRASLVDGGEIRGAGNAWICPEAEENESALDVNFSGNLCFDKILHRYLPSYLHLLPLKLGELKGDTKVSGSLLTPRFDVKWNAPRAEGSFTDARGDVIIAHDFITVNSSSNAFDLYTKVLTSYPALSWSKDEVTESNKSFVIEGLELDLRMRGFEFFNIFSSYPFDSPRPLQLKATGRVKFQGQVIKLSDTGGQQSLGSLSNMPSETVTRNFGMRSLVGHISISGLKINQLMLAPQLAGTLRLSPECVKVISFQNLPVAIFVLETHTEPRSCLTPPPPLLSLFLVFNCFSCFLWKYVCVRRNAMTTA